MGIRVAVIDDNPHVRWEGRVYPANATFHRFLSGVLEDPSGYGRVLRDGREEFVKIVEERDASPEERAVSEVNSGIYCFAREPLREALGFLRADNRQQEYYLTDTLSFIKGRGGRIGVERASDSRELFGVNNPEQLAMVEDALRAWSAP